MTNSHDTFSHRECRDWAIYDSNPNIANGFIWFCCMHQSEGYGRNFGDAHEQLAAHIGFYDGHREQGDCQMWMVEVIASERKLLNAEQIIEKAQANTDEMWFSYFCPVCKIGEPMNVCLACQREQCEEEGEHASWICNTCLADWKYRYDAPTK